MFSRGVYGLNHYNVTIIYKSTRGHNRFLRIVHFRTIIRPGDLEILGSDQRSDQILGVIVPSTLFLIRHTFAMRCCQITQIRVSVPSKKYLDYPNARVTIRNIEYDMILVGIYYQEGNRG
jgi:hypothetical protein